MNNLTLHLGKYQKNVDIRLEKMQEENFGQRLWNKDHSLWNAEKLQNEVSTIHLGWLDVVDKMIASLPMIEEFCNSKHIAEYTHLVLLGMGGSSMTPLIFQNLFKPLHKDVQLIVLDTTDPKTIREIEKKINICKTLFIVSSKSGNTIEVMAFYDYFFNKVLNIKEERAGENFIAITDKNSPLAGLAKRKKFRKLFINPPDIGGRYSALSYFGIVPAALMGVDVKEFLERTKLMIESCGPQVPLSQNPGIVLGTAIAELAHEGHDKLHYLIPPELITFGLWLEQLLAESTGKNGKGILPINSTPLAEISTYGNDSFFLSLEFLQKKAVKASTLKSLISKNYPCIGIAIENELDLGQEFFRWQIATATAGAIMNLNPFDQPNVQESKMHTNQILKKIEQDGGLPEMEIALIEDSLQYYEPQKRKELVDIITNGKLFLEDFFALTKPGDYIALLAYLPEEPEIQKYFKEIKDSLQESLHLPVTTQYGPRYLHSTGQYHKGGPNNGYFIQFICDSSDKLPIPDQVYSFDLLKKAQAIGDMQALTKNKRRIILVDLGKDFIHGLNKFKKVINTIQPIKKVVNKSYLSNKEQKNKLVFA